MKKSCNFLSATDLQKESLTWWLRWDFIETKFGRLCLDFNLRPHGRGMSILPLWYLPDCLTIYLYAQKIYATSDIIATFFLSWGSLQLKCKFEKWIGDLFPEILKSYIYILLLACLFNFQILKYLINLALYFKFFTIKIGCYCIHFLVNIQINLMVYL